MQRTFADTAFFTRIDLQNLIHSAAKHLALHIGADCASGWHVERRFIPLILAWV